MVNLLSAIVNLNAFVMMVKRVEKWRDLFAIAA